MAQATLEQIKLRKHGGSAPQLKATRKENGNKFLYIEDNGENLKTLTTAANHWNGLQGFRDRTARSWRYRRGQQWDDMVIDPSTGLLNQEKNVISSQGQIPFVVNMIAPLIRNFKGQFRSSNSRSSVIARTREDAPIGEMLTNTIRAVYDVNEGWEEDSVALEVFLTSGAAVQKVEYKYNEEKKKPFVRFVNVELTSLFFNTVKRRDLSDMTMVGEFHDMNKDDVIAAFAKNKEDEAKIRQIYGYVGEDGYDSEEHFSEEWATNRNFYFPRENNKCRVFEIWQIEGEWRYWYHDWLNAKFGDIKLTPENKLRIEQTNAQRLAKAAEYGIAPEDVALIEYKEKFVKYWKFKFLTPNGQTLLEGETPYNHKTHPYIFLLHPLIRGEVWGFVEDVIDIQRKFNRDHILMDYVIGASPKGTLVIDENSISDDFPFETIVDTYTKRNGVIKMNLKSGAQIPQQLVGKAMPVGLNESLNMGLQLMNSMSGVNDAIQGRNPGSGTPASRYAMEAQNSTMNSKDQMDAFSAFRCRRDKKMLDLIVQFYKEKEYLPISGQNYSDETKMFDPGKLTEDLSYTVSISQGTDSRAYRAIMDEQLNAWVEQGLIPMELMLKHTSMPFASQLLSDIEEMKKQAVQGAQLPPDTGMTGKIVQGLQGMGADASQADPRTVELMQRYAGTQAQA